MRQVGIHLSYWQVRWDDDLRPLIGRAKRAGFDVAEFPLLTPATLDYVGLRAALDELGMRASCGTGLGPATDITDPDRAVRAAGLAHLRACLEGAKCLGSPVLGGVTYAAWGVFPEADLGQRRRQCIASLREVAAMAADHNVTVCLEVINRFEGYLVNTVAQGLELLDAIGSPWLKLHLDTFHLNIEEDDIGAALRQAGPQLGHLHCVENNRKIPGRGHIPWAEVREALNAIDFRGSLVAEVFANPAGEVGRGLYIWRPLANDLDAAAREAADFLRRELGGV